MPPRPSLKNAKAECGREKEWGEEREIIIIERELWHGNFI